MKNSNDTIKNRTRGLPTCSLNKLGYRVPPLNIVLGRNKEQQPSCELRGCFRGDADRLSSEMVLLD